MEMQQKKGKLKQKKTADGITQSTHKHTTLDHDEEKTHEPKT